MTLKCLLDNNLKLCRNRFQIFANTFFNEQSTKPAEHIHPFSKTDLILKTLAVNDNINQR